MSQHHSKDETSKNYTVRPCLKKKKPNPICVYVHYIYMCLCIYKLLWEESVCPVFYYNLVPMSPSLFIASQGY